MIGQIRNKFGNQLRVVRYISILAFALVALGALAGGVFAKGPADSGDISLVELRSLFDQMEATEDADLTYAGFTSAQQEAVLDAMDSGEMIVETNVYAAASDNEDETCNYHSHAVKWKIRFINILIWEYRTNTRWCYDGEVLTQDPFFTRDVDTSGATWEFVRHLDESQSGGKGDTEHSDYAQGHFRQCLGIGSERTCWNDKYPSVTKRQWADGRAQAGGDV